MITTTSAPITLRTYYVDGINDKTILVTPNSGNWNDAQSYCLSQGGRLFFTADITYTYILHYIANDPWLWFGMHRYPTDPITVWRDLDNQTQTQMLPWMNGQPDNAWNFEYYLGVGSGQLHDAESIACCNA
ncbi:hypothetical protein SK128_016415, partial [Halocaridina rubra]